MTNSMQPIPFGTPYRSPRQISRVALAAAASVIMILAWAFTNGHVNEAGASEFYPNPTLSIIDECKAGVYTYDVGMYNFGATDWTTFAVISQIGGAAQKVDTYTVGPGGLKWVNFIMPEGVMSTVHVINPQGKGIDDLASPKPDCVADVNTQLLQVCDADTDAASVLYEWANTSSTAAHIALKFNGVIVKEGDYAEGDVITASILVNGITTNLIDETVDCAPEPPTTTTSTTVPPTTTSTTSTTVPTVPMSTTVPSTTSTTVKATTTSTSTTVKPTATTTSTLPVSTTSTTLVPSTLAPVGPTTIAPVVVEGVTVVRQVQQPTSRLAVTGSGSSKLAGIAIVMMAVGLALGVASRRLRARFGA